MSKTFFWEMRPWYVRTEASTRGHALVVMLAYIITHYLQKCWKSHNLKVEEGLSALNKICSQDVYIKGEFK